MSSIVILLSAFLVLLPSVVEVRIFLKSFMELKLTEHRHERVPILDLQH